MSIYFNIFHMSSAHLHALILFLSRPPMPTYVKTEQQESLSGLTAPTYSAQQATRRRRRRNWWKANLLSCNKWFALAYTAFSWTRRCRRRRRRLRLFNSTTRSSSLMRLWGSRNLNWHWLVFLSNFLLVTPTSTSQPPFLPSDPSQTNQPTNSKYSQKSYSNEQQVRK